MKVQLITNGLKTLELIQLAQDIHTKMTGNANFASPTPALAALQTAINTAQTALDAADAAFALLRQRRAERRAASDALADALEMLAGYVQAASGGDEAKIFSAGMSTRQPPVPVGPLPAVQNLRAEFGAMEGTAVLFWDGLYGARAYSVECATSLNGPWTQVALVTGTTVTVNSLTSGAKYYFRVRALGAAGPGPWSDPAIKMAA